MGANGPVFSDDGRAECQMHGGGEGRSWRVTSARPLTRFEDRAGNLEDRNPSRVGDMATNWVVNRTPAPASRTLEASVTATFSPLVLIPNEIIATLTAIWWGRVTHTAGKVSDA